jgi:acyl-CoA reductase-like NAD-dependent aldehyde dehydrogenase
MAQNGQGKSGTDDRAPRPELDRLLERLARRRRDWVNVTTPDRIAYLRACTDGLIEVAADWVAEAVGRRGIDAASPLAGEEWISGPMTTARYLRLLAAALRAKGRPAPRALEQRADGQWVASVFPGNLVDRLVFYNMTGEVWIRPGEEPTQGRIYREKAEGRCGPGGLCLVLGAGNISSIPPLDLLYKLFVEDQVVLLKMNPVNAYLGPYLERAFAPLIRDGYLGVTDGGAEDGAYLCRHPDVDSIHLTGSKETYDAIVWGADEAVRAERKAAGKPLLDKPLTAELGCVSPVLVVPGRWSSGDLEFQARHVAAMVAHNASFNCNAGKVLVLARGWDRRESFLDRVKAAMARTPPRIAYYPGAQRRYEEFLAHYPGALPLGTHGDGVVPWTLIPDVPPVEGEYALAREAFCGVLAHVDLEAAGPADFLDRAVRFANEKVWGTLSCTVLIDAATRREHATALDRAVAGLRYGGVGINVWPGVLYALGTPSWGAFPGHTREEIGSGSGVVHNACLFDHPEKSVLRAAFRIRPKPVWFPDHRSLRALGRQLTRFEAYRSTWRLPAVAFFGMTG